MRSHCTPNWATAWSWVPVDHATACLALAGGALNSTFAPSWAKTWIGIAGPPGGVWHRPGHLNSKVCSKLGKPWASQACGSSKRSPSFSKFLSLHAARR